MLGFPPSAVPDQSTIKQRWRRLARIYHPDSPFGDHERMTQLNAAAERLV
ncbi:MAG: J domain-containing protein [Alphaproteobacteria bacterium]|nr:J domain-containing protein [Alphaproteobacteria bacterium]